MKNKVQLFLLGIVTWIVCTSNLTIENTSILKSKQALGHLLFFDTRLSINNTKSCASCHNPQLYFTDGYRQALGAYADVQIHNTPSVLNTFDDSFLNWAEPIVTNYKQQMLTPLFGNTHIEMGMQQNSVAVLKTIFSSKIYAENKAVKDTINHNWQFVIDCIAEYQKLLFSRNSMYDYYINNKIELPTNIKKGYKLFTKIGCAKCHGGADFNTSPSGNFANNNCIKNYNNEADKGLYNVTKNSADVGKFKIPSLRNVMQTAPYMHNGSFNNINEVLDNYLNNLKLPSSETESKTVIKKRIVVFLESLTDTTVLYNPLFNNPFVIK